MRPHTIEDNFDYQVKQILKKIKKDYAEELKQSGKSLPDFLWDNPEIVGKVFFETTDEYLGMNDACSELDSK